MTHGLSPLGRSVLKGFVFSERDTVKHGLRYYYTMELTKRAFLVGAAGSISVALAGCSVETGEFEGVEDDEDDNGDESSQEVELLSHQMVRKDEGEPFEALLVEGEAENVSGGELSDAAVEVTFYDSSDRLLESSLDSIGAWAAGETWKFETKFPGTGDEASDVVDYQIRAGTSL